MDVEPMDLIRDKVPQDYTIKTVLQLGMIHFDMSEERTQAETGDYFRIKGMMEENRLQKRRLFFGRSGVPWTPGILLPNFLEKLFLVISSCF